MERRLRTLGLVEGCSFLVLLLVAMPLKYLADLPIAVKIIGSIHGALFVAFVALALFVAKRVKWPAPRLALAVLAAFIPLGPFLFDSRLFPRGPEIPAGTN